MWQGHDFFHPLSRRYKRGRTPREGGSLMIRIVFVDDDVNVLEAMQRTMRPMRHEWSMEFVSSGSEALESLAKAPADVIVTDMCMPGMDGWQLLAEIKTLYP